MSSFGTLPDSSREIVLVLYTGRDSIALRIDAGVNAPTYLLLGATALAAYQSGETVAITYQEVPGVTSSAIGILVGQGASQPTQCPFSRSTG